MSVQKISTLLKNEAHLESQLVRSIANKIVAVKKPCQQMENFFFKILKETIESSKIKHDIPDGFFNLPISRTEVIVTSCMYTGSKEHKSPKHIAVNMIKTFANDLEEALEEYHMIRD